MSLPMRKDDFIEEDLTTADLARGKRPVSHDPPTNDLLERETATEARPVPVLTERGMPDHPAPEGLRSTASDVNATETMAASDTRSPAPPSSTPLFPSNELDELRNRWNTVQAAFVDEPRRAVEQADGLVASAMKRLAEVFAQERSNLEHQWDRGDNVSTEDLRIALQRYRSFFHRLLAV